MSQNQDVNCLLRKMFPGSAVCVASYHIFTPLAYLIGQKDLLGLY